MNLWARIFFAGMVLWGIQHSFAPEVKAQSAPRTFIVGDTRSLQNFDSAFCSVGVDVFLCRNIYQSLVRYKFNSNEFEGELARSWTVSGEGTVYRFRLRDDVRWHKGFGKFTAHDVKYSFDRVMAPETASSSGMELAREIKDARVIDDYTIEFTLNKACKPFLHLLAGPRGGGIVNRRAVEQFGNGYGRNPVGTGPFVFESWAQEHCSLKANESFHEGPPGVQRIVFKTFASKEDLGKALERGEIDLTWILPDDKSELGKMERSGYRLVSWKSTVFQNLWMDNKTKPFDNLLVRRAVAHAIDKDALVKALRNNSAERLDSPIPKGFWGHTEEGIPRYPYKPEYAKTLLDGAGYAQGLEITLDLFSSPDYLPLAAAIVEQLSKINIRVKLNVIDPIAWWMKLSQGNSNFALAMPSRQPDADFVLRAFYHSASFSPGFNVCRYDKIDDLIEKGRVEQDEKKRKEIYREIQRKWMEDVPGIPLLMRPSSALIKSHFTNIPEWDPLYGIDVYRLKIQN